MPKKSKTVIRRNRRKRDLERIKSSMARRAKREDRLSSKNFSASTQKIKGYVRKDGVKVKGYSRKRKYTE